MNKINDKFLEVLKHEGVVSIMSWGIEPHLVNTWNSYLVITEDERILIPAYGFRKTQKNVEVNNKVKIRARVSYNGYYGRFVTYLSQFDSECGHQKVSMVVLA